MNEDEDRRVDERSDCNLSATIETLGGSKISCVVKDLSTAGAKIKIDDSVSLPERFDLLIPAIPGADQRFKVVMRWRQSGVVGGEFLSVVGQS